MSLRFSEAAEHDLTRIYAFNEQRSSQWAGRVEQRPLDRAEALLRFPQLGRPIRKAGLRRLSVTDIQYVIDYRIDGTAIEILRFRHTREMS